MEQEIDKARLLNTEINMPFPMSCLPEGQKIVLGLAIMAIEDSKKLRR